jgi:pimeloyl-ACP methyl ester carboxylesterase
MRKLLVSMMISGLGLSGPVVALPGAGKPGDRPFSNSRFIEINNQNLHYRIWPSARPDGSGQWILLVHGMGGSTFSWEYNAPALAAAGFHVVAVDVPPFGYSDKNPDENQALDVRARMLWNFCDRVTPDVRWHLIGHSMGGGIVQCMAVIHPEKTERVVFTDPALFMSMEDKSHASMPAFRFRPFEWLAVGIGNSMMIRPKGIRKMLRSAYAAEPPEVDVNEYYKALSVGGTAKALIRSTAVSKPLTPVDGLSFNKPAIAIWGDRDKWVPLEKAKPLVDKIPAIRMIVIEGAGHCPMATHPQEYNRTVIDFLRTEKP